MTLRSVGGERVVALGDLWTGPGSTTATSDELLVAVDLPAPAATMGSCYVRLEYRRQMEIAVVGATAAVVIARRRWVRAGRQDRDHRARADDPRVVPEAERALNGSDGGAAAIEEAAAATAAASSPISDVRGSAEYRLARWRR